MRPKFSGSRYNSIPLTAEEIQAQLRFEELLELIQELSPVYRMVFNLYVFERMKHHEIAERLGISTGTSKSNLADARRFLKKRIEQAMLKVNV